jgi:hypothetical protein
MGNETTTLDQYKKSRRVLGWICVVCITGTVICPALVTVFAPASWAVKHTFWLAWEATGVLVTVVLTFVFWVYEFFVDKMPLPKRLTALCSLLVFLGGVFVFLAALGAILHWMSVAQAGLLVLGALLWAGNSYLVWQHHKDALPNLSDKPDLRQVAEDSARRYQGCFKFSDFPALAVFLVLLLFLMLLPALPVDSEWLTHRDDEIRAFLAGAVAFQFMASNAAYTIEFSPFELPLRLTNLSSKLTAVLAWDSHEPTRPSASNHLGSGPGTGGHEGG